jgi:hypothetical protein
MINQVLLLTMTGSIIDGRGRVQKSRMMAFTVVEELSGRRREVDIHYPHVT